LKFTSAIRIKYISRRKLAFLRTKINILARKLTFFFLPSIVAHDFSRAAHARLVAVDIATLA